METPNGEIELRLMTYTKQDICDYTLDNAQLVKHCPLDNGRHNDASITPHSTLGQLDKLPPEVSAHVLLYADLPSLTSFRRVNRRAMELVDSIPEYSAILKHCPNIIRAILSINADAFNCHVLYQTLSTTKCSTCDRFGDHLYLIHCRRVCYFCFTKRLEYLPLTEDDLMRSPHSVYLPSHPAIGFTNYYRTHMQKLPHVMALPGRYGTASNNGGGQLVQWRTKLFDRQGNTRDHDALGLAHIYKPINEPRRFMTIISAPHLFDAGQQADWGYFCLGCKDEQKKKNHIVDKGEGKKHYRIKYTQPEILDHLNRYGLVILSPWSRDKYVHATTDN